MKPNKLSSDVVNLLNPRIKNEYEAHFFYRAASNWCKNVGFEKAAEYFAKEAEDELTHAKKLEDYLVDWNVNPELPVIDAQDNSFSGLMDVIEKAYRMEYNLYDDYEDISVKIFKLNDLCVFDFLQFFRVTQKEAVAEYSDKINLLDGVDTKSKFELLALENQLFG